MPQGHHVHKFITVIDIELIDLHGVCGNDGMTLETSMRATSETACRVQGNGPTVNVTSLRLGIGTSLLAILSAVLTVFYESY